MRRCFFDIGLRNLTQDYAIGYETRTNGFSGAIV